MNSLDQQFTDKLYANYEANMKYAAINFTGKTQQRC